MSTETGRTGASATTTGVPANGNGNGDAAVDLTASTAAASADLLDPRLQQARGVRGYLSATGARLKSGDVGSLPVLIGLVLIAVIFQLLNPTFLNAFNLVNLLLQVASIGIMAAGVSLVLMLGEIDLSVGSVSGASAAIVAVANVRLGLDPALCVLLALAAGAAIGALHGVVFTKLGVPAFVVTLAGLLGWLGVQLAILGRDGTVNLPPSGGLVAIGQQGFVPVWLAYVGGIAVVAVYVISRLVGDARRRKAGLPTTPLWVTIFVAAVLLVLFVAVAVKLSIDRGVPWIFVLMAAIVVGLDWILRRTSYGRAVFAVGGNIEAARRAGFKVDRIRISVFMLASTLAALGGVVATMRLGFANQQSGAADTLINAIAAGVIGGVSLFGGRARQYAPLLGALVIGGIANGLELLSLASEQRYMITGAVLLIAVIIDSVLQRGRNRRGS